MSFEKIVVGRVIYVLQWLLIRRPSLVFLGGYTMVYTSWSRKPSMLNRRSTLPALLDVNSESLMLSRQLHLDFHEVKCVVPWYMEQCLASSGGVKRKSDCDHFIATEVDIVVDGLPVFEEVTISCTPERWYYFKTVLQHFATTYHL